MNSSTPRRSKNRRRTAELDKSETNESLVSAAAESNVPDDGYTWVVRPPTRPTMAQRWRLLAAGTLFLTWLMVLIQLVRESL